MPVYVFRKKNALPKSCTILTCFLHGILTLFCMVLYGFLCSFIWFYKVFFCRECCAGDLCQRERLFRVQKRRASRHIAYLSAFVSIPAQEQTRQQTSRLFVCQHVYPRRVTDAPADKKRLPPPETVFLLEALLYIPIGVGIRD